MAGGASSSLSTTSSSFSASDFTHDAFLSFRGEDTRYGFTGNLYSALKNRGINTFFDDKELPIGNEIRPSLLSAIERSRTAIVVLSKDYASSSFCLDELVKIMDCIHRQGRLVIPIFYEVAPTDVRHLTKTYGDALNAHENKFKANKDKFNYSNNMDRLQRWREALKQVADLSGYHFEHGGDYEYQFIANIVEHVSRQIRRRLLPTADHPVGLVARVQEVTKLLDLGSDDIRMVGIHGIGGVGKTTLAVAVYNAIANSVEHLSFRLCFMGDVRENLERHGLPHLQKIVLSELFGEKGEVTCVKHGISILKSKLEGKKILLVLDDVDQEEQLKALAGESNWFGRGSRVIVTTRDRNLLSRYEDQITYELETLNEKDALELLSWKALKTNQVDSSYMNILNEVVIYASGLPLALEVIGSNLVGKSIAQWNSILCQYKRIPKKDIQTILKVSFDALEEFEREIFLDVACCLKGYGLNDVKEILCAHHNVDSLDYAFRVLVEKSLMKTHAYWEGVTLHDLIQDMGREIVRQELPKTPGKRSRLWFLEDIVQVFERNEGTDKIEMIHMDFPISEKVINWDGEAFKKMTNIRTLIIERARFSQGPKLLPNSLRVLKWQQYPSHSLPVGFHSEELVIFQLGGIRLMSVEFLHKQKFKGLTVINFDRSNIKEMPDLSGVPNLKKLSFGFCGNLIKVHESVGFLDKLKFLNAPSCRSLRSFPPIRLTNLEHLGLEGCSSLENFPEILGEMENILQTAVYGTSIKELPSSIAYLSKLRRLTWGNSATSLSISSIAMLPCLEELSFVPFDKRLQFPKLDEGKEQRSSMLSPNGIKVALRYCDISDEYWSVLVAWFRNVVELDLSRNNFTVLPESIQELCSLRRLVLSGCKKLQEIRGIPPNMNDFLAVECISLTCSSKMMLLNEEFHKDGNKLVRLPGSTIPEWFEHNTTGSTTPEWFNDNNTDITIEFWCRNKVPEICLCAIGDNYDPEETISWDLCINGNVVSGYSFPGRCYTGHIAIAGLKRMTFDHENLDEFLSENEWNHVECSFYLIDQPMRLETGVRMRWKIGVHVINHKSSMEDDIRFSDPEDDFRSFLPAENSLKDYVSNSVAQIGISSTTNNVQENTAAESSQAPPSDVTSGEEHLRTCCTELPTSDDSFRIQIDPNQDDDVEMEKFYASLDSGSHVLSCSHDHSATMAPNKEAREALKIVQDFITNNDASVFLDLEQCSIMKTSLDCLSNLSENGGLSEEMRALVSEASRVFTHCNSNYIEANMKIESSASELLRADELEVDLEDNKNQFKKVVALEREQLQKLACLEESKKELEKQINAINGNILVSQSEQNMTRKRKRDIFEEGKTLKTQVDKLKEKVSYLQHEQDLAKETQEKIKAEWSGLGEKFRKIVVEYDAKESR